MTTRARRSEVTLGALADRQHRLFGWCVDCSRRYDPKLGPRSPPSAYDIDLAALVAARGRECLIVEMPPVQCPRCGSRRTAAVGHRRRGAFRQRRARRMNNAISSAWAAFGKGSG